MKATCLHLVAGMALAAGSIPGLAAPATAGNQIDLPQAIDINPNPSIFETNITAVEAMVDLDGNGLLANSYTFNGTVPGPEIRVKAGDTVIVHFRNLLPTPSSIHWHGLELNNASDGTSVTQNETATGETYDYIFIATRPGIFWYHPHIKSTNPEFKGQFGSLIVTSNEEQTLISQSVIPHKAHTKTLVLSDATLCRAAGSNDPFTFPTNMPNLPWAGGAIFPGNAASPTPQELCETKVRDNDGNLTGGPALPAGAIPNIQPPVNCKLPGSGDVPCRVNDGQIVLTNGRTIAARTGSPSAPGAVSPNGGLPTLEVKKKQGLRLRIINSAVTRYFRLLMTDQNGTAITLFRIGGEGGLLDQVRIEGGLQGTTATEPGVQTKYDPGEILVAPADRADFVIVVPEGAEGDILTLWTRDYDRNGFGFSNTPTMPVLHLKIVGTAANSFTIAEMDLLLTHSAVAKPTEDISGLPAVPLTAVPAGKKGTTNTTIVLKTADFMGARLPSVDGVHGIFDAQVPDFTTIPTIDSSRYGRVGDVLELTVKNETGAHHPFHLHGFSVQLLRELGPDGVTVLREFDHNEFVDVFDLQKQHSMVFKVRLDDRPMMDGVSPGGAEGRWLFHCHIFFHGNLGMISELFVLPARTRALPWLKLLLLNN